MREFRQASSWPMRDVMHLMIVVSDNTATNLSGAHQRRITSTT